MALAFALEPAGAVGVAIVSSVSFAVMFFYHVPFEVLGGGRTPGKRLSGLRVVLAGGRPIGLVASALRNILRVIDVLPGVYLVGMLSIFITAKNQRIGDLAAGSLVVRDRHGGRRGEAVPAILGVDPGPAANWDVSGIGPEEVVAVRTFLERREQLDPRPRRALGADLAARLRPRVRGVAPDVHDEVFLELLVAAKSARR